jgi:hypothetical protein
MTQPEPVNGAERLGGRAMTHLSRSFPAPKGRRVLAALAVASCAAASLATASAAAAQQIKQGRLRMGLSDVGVNPELGSVGHKP